MCAHVDRNSISVCEGICKDNKHTDIIYIRDFTDVVRFQTARRRDFTDVVRFQTARKKDFTDVVRFQTARRRLH